MHNAFTQKNLSSNQQTHSVVKESVVKQPRTFRRITQPLSDSQPLSQPSPFNVEQRQGSGLYALPQVKAYSTCDEYNFSSLVPYLSRTYPLSPPLFSDVVHFQVDNQEIFVFKTGSIVAWGTSASFDKRFMEDIKEHSIKTYTNVESDEMPYAPSCSQFSNISNSTIYIASNDDNVLKDKLAISHGLSNSVKLATVEALLEEHLESVKGIPEFLTERKGGLAMGRAAVLGKMGELLCLRGRLNLHSELTDTPDIYWSEPQLEALYNRICSVLDMKPRTAAINRKLDYAHEVVQILKDHLSEKHSLKLEWFIIILIAVEVAFNIVHYMEKLGYISFPN